MTLRGSLFALVPFALVGLMAVASPAHAAPVSIVAAENMYADIARQIAGPDARISAIISNPDQDPHEFEPSPSAARLVAEADVVILNGAGYDPWMARLLSASRNGHRRIIDIARLLDAPATANPHLWYDPRMAPALARALADDLPPESGAAARRDAFLGSLGGIGERIAAIRARFTGTAVAATEPVFDPMADAIGLKVLERRFAISVMNGTEPAASDVAEFELDLQARRAKALIYNRQASGSAVRRLLDIAEKAGVPTVPVTETEPAGTSYQHWILAELDALEAALSR